MQYLICELLYFLPQDRHDNQVDVETPATESKHLLPELEMFFYLLVLVLIKEIQQGEAKWLSFSLNFVTIALAKHHGII